MADDFPRDRAHIHLRNNGIREAYRRPNQLIHAPPLPARDRASHAAALTQSIEQAVESARQQIAARDLQLSVGTPGFYLEIDLPMSGRAALDQLADRRQHMELVAVHEPTQPGAPITASVFLPQSAQTYYLRKVEAYRDVDTDRGRPRNEPLVSRMETVRLATARSLFTDHDDLFPQAADEQVWWEVWLRDGRRENFEHIAEALNITLRTHAVRFPERVVMLALASTAMLDRMIAHSDVVAELRRAKDTPSFFMGLGGAGYNMQANSTPNDDQTGISALVGFGAQARGAPGRLLPEIWVQYGAKRVEQALARLLCAEGDGETELMAAMRYATLHGGKRTRALLCLAAGALADTSAHMIYDVGAAIEMMHACTLVHDDLPAMDDDVLRRGLPTVHVKFGEATAILVGDALQAHAFLTLASLDAPGDNRIALVRELAQAVSAEGAAGGQAMDLSLVGKHVELNKIVAMHRMKSGALVRASVRMGALCAIAEDSAHAALYDALDRYSACFGLALQVVDDILDATADTAALGKTPGKDAAAQKPTCASIMGLQAARQFALDLLRDAGEAIALLGPRAERLAQMLQRANAYLLKHAPCA